MPSAISPNLQVIYHKQRDYFNAGMTRDIGFRRNKLRTLGTWMRRNEGEIFRALHHDLRKSPAQAYIGELGLMLREVEDFHRQLPKWATPKKVATPLVLNGPLARSRIIPEPKGITLLIGPWNYPFALMVAPLIASVGAGNTAILKPSERAHYTGELLDRLVAEVFEPGHVAVVRGGPETGEALLEHRFDHVFFTGGTETGRQIYQAAARHLTPVTLELGGRSPVIVDHEVDLPFAVRHIADGKTFNAGQSCNAPNHVFLPREMIVQFIGLWDKTIHQFFGDASKSPDYGRLIDGRHFYRLLGFLPYGNILSGGRHEIKDLYFEPTLMEKVVSGSPLDREEIFGPILPLYFYDSLDEVIESIAQGPKPLALYSFSTNRAFHQLLQRKLSYGGGCSNDTLSNYVSHLPFGGVGESGMGRYHGRWGFEAFSHWKGVLEQTDIVDFPMRYPPFQNRIPRLIRRLFGG